MRINSLKGCIHFDLWIPHLGTYPKDGIMNVNKDFFLIIRESENLRQLLTV